jgi:uncharacterized protein
MLGYELNQKAEQPPVVSLLLILVTIFLGFAIVGPMVGFFISMPFYPGSTMEYLEALQGDIPQHPEIKTALYVMQGCATTIGLIFAPALFLKTQQRSVKNLFVRQSPEPLPALLTIIIVIVFMGLNSFFVEWNSAIEFPEFMKGFETWARQSEDKATGITQFLTHFDSTLQVFVALLVIAILPAVGEELVFRGLIQKEFYRGTKNIHVSIWISAILFSAIHIQFYGFVPRMLLGALFGYLYYWSGSLWISILAHFINNGIAVLGMYLHQMGYFDFDVESPEAAPWPVVLFSGVLTVILLYSFRRYYRQKATMA